MLANCLIEHRLSENNIIPDNFSMRMTNFPTFFMLNRRLLRDEEKTSIFEVSTRLRCRAVEWPSIPRLPEQFLP